MCTGRALHEPYPELDALAGRVDYLVHMKTGLTEWTPWEVATAEVLAFNVCPAACASCGGEVLVSWALMAERRGACWCEVCGGVEEFWWWSDAWNVSLLSALARCAWAGRKASRRRIGPGVGGEGMSESVEEFLRRMGRDVRRVSPDLSAEARGVEDRSEATGEAPSKGDRERYLDELEQRGVRLPSRRRVS